MEESKSMTFAIISGGSYDVDCNTYIVLRRNGSCF